MFILEGVKLMDKKKRTKFDIAQEDVQIAFNETNKRIEVLGIHTNNLYGALTDIQEFFDKIRNIPTEKNIEYKKIKKIRLNWKQQADKIKRDYDAAVLKNAGAGAAGAGAGVAVVAMGPTVAMGVATTFGVASTGTAISTLSGAAATNAALAWLGGGALATGGGGMAAGSAFLSLAGPVGWTIAGISLVASGAVFFKTVSEKKQLEDIFTLISIRDTKSYNLAIVELNERIIRIDDETEKLKSAILTIQTFGYNYDEMTEWQQYELGAYVNLMSSSTQLLVNPIKGLKPNYSDKDYEKYIYDRKWASVLAKPNKKIIIYLANLLYNINLNYEEKKLLWKTLRKDNTMLESMDVSKKDFDMNIIDTVFEALKHKDELNV